MKYRAEIDGLRAVAVLPVMMFHAQVPGFSGGFVGVDVFFVISGYLITLIILDAQAQGGLRLLDFYERRARRLLPMLLLVIAVSFPLAWQLMLPDALENFGQSVVASLLFGNNILLWLTSGYWDLQSEFKPLIHTWSLAVEEHFYLIYPATLLLALRPGRWLAVVLVSATLALSLGLCLALYRAMPDASFYLLPTRAWELMAGASCALAHRSRMQLSNPWLAAAGLVLIACSVVAFDKTTPFPSHYTLLPVLGAALFIGFAKPEHAVTRLMSQRWLVGIGLVSYSAYLWHQPLLAFARLNSVSEPHWQTLGLICLACLPLSWLSWRFVERPARRRTTLPSRRFWISHLGVAGILAGAGLALHLLHGVPGRMFASGQHDMAAGMQISYNMRIYQYQRDRFAAGTQRKVLILGNSFARDFFNAALEAGALMQDDVIYRDDIGPCFSFSPRPASTDALLHAADIVIFASGQYRPECLAQDNAWLRSASVQRTLYIGPKDFGYKLKVFARTAPADRPRIQVRMKDKVILSNAFYAERIPAGQFVDLIALLSPDGRTMPAFTEDGNIISQDGKHLTRAGARYFGQRVFCAPPLSELWTVTTCRAVR